MAWLPLSRGWTVGCVEAGLLWLAKIVLLETSNFRLPIWGLRCCSLHQDSCMEASAGQIQFSRHLDAPVRILPGTVLVLFTRLGLIPVPALASSTVRESSDPVALMFRSYCSVDPWGLLSHGLLLVFRCSLLLLFLFQIRKSKTQQHVSFVRITQYIDASISFDSATKVCKHHFLWMEFSRLQGLLTLTHPCWLLSHPHNLRDANTCLSSIGDFWMLSFRFWKT